jgi:hypothetical protein
VNVPNTTSPTASMPVHIDGEELMKEVKAKAEDNMMKRNERLIVVIMDRTVQTFPPYPLCPNQSGVCGAVLLLVPKLKDKDPLQMILSRKKTAEVEN